ncbi:MAG: hypothetical protein KFF73_11080 [Cyclobacteriaceae bacterium]|nr:hypothetical protein [Cyclobacteriaceae bacterium]
MESYLYLEKWNLIGRYIAFAIGAIGILMAAYHFLRLMLTVELKKRYDFINRYEIRSLWTSALLIIIAIGFYVNTLVNEGEIIWLLVRVFVTIMVGLIIGVIISNLLKFYYPFYVEKRLRKLRYTPRKSPKTGKPMKLLSEEEEDVYLDEGMQAEENVFSVDYDVWIDEETGHTKIEKYAGHLVALQCPECSYQTLKVVKEEILESPTETEEGELMKFYKCDYCGYKERKAFRVARLKKVEGYNKSSAVL